MLHHAFNNAAIGMAFIEPKGICLKVNQCFCQMIGYTEQELLLMNFHSLLHPDDHARSLQHAENLLSGMMNKIQLQLRINHRQGHFIWIMLSTSLIVDDQSDPLYFFTLIQDITELKESEQRYKSLFDHHPDAIASLDLEGNFLGANLANERITGQKTEDLVKKSRENFIIQEDLEKAKHHFLQTVQGEPQNYDLKARHKDGHPIEYNVTSIPAIIDHKITGVFSIIRDITKQKKLLKEEDQLRKLDKLSAVGQLAAGVAHEIRNPLTVIKGFLQLLHEKTEGNQPYFNIMFSELDRIVDILKEFMLLAKPSSLITKKEQDICRLIDHVTMILRTQAVLSNVRIVTEFDQDVLLLSCDENQIKQVLVNIMKNAIEAMPAGGQLMIKAKREKTCILIRFMDQGDGMTQEEILKLGEPFYTTKETGTGLGLMMCYKIIEAHKGSLAVQSQKGLGTIMEIRLNLHK
ncbi:MAG TPA: PAS domain S-box protein [Bacilli bacterium]